MKHSDSITKISPAIIAAQSELKAAPKDSVNPHFRSKYADLATCMEVLKPILSKHGLAVMQFPGGSGDVVTVETVLIHTSGEWLSCEAVSKPRDMAPQSVGSAITYLRRYGLAIIGLVTDEDDDGNAATHKAEAKPKIENLSKTLAKPMTEEEKSDPFNELPF